MKRFYSVRPPVFNTIQSFKQFRHQLKGRHAFVPTMGALHEGHLHLVKEAKKFADTVSVSIFVNPAQFAPHEDLSKYPRPLEKDLSLLAQLNCVDAVFVPSVEEIYPSGIQLNVNEQIGTFVEVKGKSHQLEGQIRPHFFRGVCTVVSKLFHIVEPDLVLFGQKDAQQCIVIRQMIHDLFFPLEMKVIETIREVDGLAKSSRNVYLSEENRRLAPVLYQALQLSQKQYQKGARLKSEILKPALDLFQSKKIHVEYFQLSDSKTLNDLEVVGEHGALLSGAIKLGQTRLIDNILLGCQL